MTARPIPADNNGSRPDLGVPKREFRCGRGGTELRVIVRASSLALGARSETSERARSRRGSRKRTGDTRRSDLLRHLRGGALWCPPSPSRSWRYLLMLALYISRFPRPSCKNSGVALGQSGLDFVENSSIFWPKVYSRCCRREEDHGTRGTTLPRRSFPAKRRARCTDISQHHKDVLYWAVEAFCDFARFSRAVRRPLGTVSSVRPQALQSVLQLLGRLGAFAPATRSGTKCGACATGCSYRTGAGSPVHGNFTATVRSALGGNSHPGPDEYGPRDGFE